MSIYPLPRVHHPIYLSPSSEESSRKKGIFVSYSLAYYYHEVQRQILEALIQDNSVHSEGSRVCLGCRMEEMMRSIHPYDFLFRKVPGTNVSVSKCNPESSTFYDMIEIMTGTLFMHRFKGSSSISRLAVSRHASDIVEAWDVSRELASGFSGLHGEDSTMVSENITDDFLKSLGDTKYDCLYLEVVGDCLPCLINLQDAALLNTYYVSLAEMMLVLLRNQNEKGSAILKINHVFHPFVVDFLYILSSLYESVDVQKPLSNTSASFDRYVICQNALPVKEGVTRMMRMNYYRLIVFLKKLEPGQCVHRLLDIAIPSCFSMRIDDFNIGIGQQQLDIFDTMINILRNRNKEERLESIKKSNIQKSVSWCEKYKIPCNKFSEKMNIFLPVSSGAALKMSSSSSSTATEEIKCCFARKEKEKEKETKG